MAMRCASLTIEASKVRTKFFVGRGEIYPWSGIIDSLRITVFFFIERFQSNSFQCLGSLIFCTRRSERIFTCRNHAGGRPHRIISWTWKYGCSVKSVRWYGDGKYYFTGSLSTLSATFSGTYSKKIRVRYPKSQSVVPRTLKHNSRRRPL